MSSTWDSREQTQPGPWGGSTSLRRTSMFVACTGHKTLRGDPRAIGRYPMRKYGAQDPYLREMAQCWRDGVGTGSRSRARTCRMPIKLGGLLDCQVGSQRLKNQRRTSLTKSCAQKGALRIKFTIAPKSRTTRDRDVPGLFGPRSRYGATYLERKGSRRCLPPHTPLRAGSGAYSTIVQKNGITRHKTVKKDVFAVKG